MDYACGGELFSLLRKEGSFSNDVALFYSAEVILSLAYLHSLEIAYRDLKPENLLIGKDGHLMITDFGFAKKIKDKSYTMCGTPEYLSPEQISKKGHDHSVDWWSLGVLIYEMLVGVPPFFDMNPLKVFERVLDGTFLCPQEIGEEAIDLIKNLLNKDPVQRLQFAKKIIKHDWFDGVDWDDIKNKEIPAPWTPNIKDPTDTRFF